VLNVVVVVDFVVFQVVVYVVSVDFVVLNVVVVE